ncbi:MAG TPA: hypothetical protein VG184_09375 [Acidimicrobiales bacterium]|nr:hypothetical protein [Acidimicrobiales bacterium]
MDNSSPAGRPGPPPGPEEIITCIDCLGRAHLLTTWAPDDPPRPGDVVAYRCEDCLDRWDLVVPDTE